MKLCKTVAQVKLIVKIYFSFYVKDKLFNNVVNEKNFMCQTF